MWSVKLLGVVLMQIVVMECSSSECIKSEKSVKKHIQGGYERNRYGYDEFSPAHDELVIESVHYNCYDVTLPLDKIPAIGSVGLHSELIISSMVHTAVPPLSFSQYNFFTVIRMKNLGIQEILPAAFNSLTQLKELDISNNSISKLPDGVMSSLSNLEILDVSSNHLENITEHSFVGLKALKLLNLSSNHILNFDTSSVYSAERVQVDLSFNKLTHFNFNNVSGKIEKLDVSHNLIAALEGCFSTIQSLNLQHNKLTKMENNSCGTSSNITDLDLGYNLISEFSTGTFSSIPSLINLYLDHNNLSFLETDIFSNLDSLQTLNLSGNHFKDFDHGVFENCWDLMSLDLSNNGLTDIKRYFHSLVNLRKLDLRYNYLTYLDSSQLIQDLPQLQTLFLEGNNLPCEELIEIYHNLRTQKITLQVGSTKSTHNIQGIACKRSTKGVEKVFRDKDSSLWNWKYEATETSMYNFFNDGFKDSSFYKYLESLNQNHLLKFNETELVKYFDKDFKNTTFFKLFDNFNYSISIDDNVIEFFNTDLKNYLNKSQELDNFLHANFTSSAFYNFFVTGFRKSQFYQDFQTVLNSSQLNATPFRVEDLEILQKFLSNYSSSFELKNSKAEKLRENLNSDFDHDKYYGIFLAMVFLLVILIFVVSVSTFVSVKLYFELVRTHHETREQLELIQS